MQGIKFLRCFLSLRLFPWCCSPFRWVCRVRHGELCFGVRGIRILCFVGCCLTWRVRSDSWLSRLFLCEVSGIMFSCFLPIFSIAFEVRFVVFFGFRVIFWNDPWWPWLIEGYLDVLDLLFDSGCESQFGVGLSCQWHHEVVEVAAGSHGNKIISN